MRILLISNLLPPHYIGGYEIGAKEYGEALRERGHEVRAVTSTYHARGDEDDAHWVARTLRENDDLDGIMGGTKVPTRLSTLRNLVWDRRNAAEIRGLLDGFRPELVYAWKCGGLSVAPLWLPLSRGLPVVAHLCDDWLLRYRPYRLQEYLAGVPKVTPLMHLIHYQLRRMTLFATSSLIRKDYEAAGFPSANIHVIHYGLADHHWKRARVIQRRRKRNRLLFVGQLWRGKGVHCLIEAVKILTREHPEQDFTLDVIGSCMKDYERELRELTRSLDVQRQVRFLGKRPREELWKAYRQYDMMIMPSVWPEPQGNTLLEAMVNGLPVLASRIGGLLDVVENEVSGILFEPENPRALADAVLRVARNEALARRIAQGAIRINGDKFNLATILPNVERIFLAEVEKAAGNRQRRHRKKPN